MICSALTNSAKDGDSVSQGSQVKLVKAAPADSTTKTFARARYSFLFMLIVILRIPTGLSTLVSFIFIRERTVNICRSALTGLWITCN